MEQCDEKCAGADFRISDKLTCFRFANFNYFFEGARSGERKQVQLQGFNFNCGLVYWVNAKSYKYIIQFVNTNNIEDFWILDIKLSY